jgi:1-deoxy-D-xylulose-5-phosphate reductoisomerase
MGNKVTIDSATHLQQGIGDLRSTLALRSAAEKIQVMVHPESVIHSMVEFRGSVRCRAAFAAGHEDADPIRADVSESRRPGRERKMDWSQKFALNFEPPDMQRFPALSLRIDAIRAGGTMGAVLNAANEGGGAGIYVR